MSDFYRRQAFHIKQRKAEGQFLQAASSGNLDTLIQLKSQALPKVYEALQLAACNGHAAAVRELLDGFSHWCFTRKDANVSSGASDVTEWCSKAFNDFVSTGGGTILREMVSKNWYFFGAKLTSSPIHLAVQEGHFEVVQEIINVFRNKRVLQSFDKSDKEGRECARRWFQELVEWSIRWGNVDIVRLLLTQPLLPLPMPLPLMHLAVYHDHSCSIVRLLLELIIQQQQKPTHSQVFELLHFSQDGLTPLHIAAQCGSLSAVQLLLDSATEAHNLIRVDVNETSHPELFTPLHIAASFGHAHVISFLLQSLQEPAADQHSTWTVDPMAQDCMGRTALHYAAREGHEAAVDVLVNNLKMQGKGIASKADYDGLLPLHMAARAGHVNVIKILRSQYMNGVNSRAKDSLQLRHLLELMYLGRGSNILSNVYFGVRYTINVEEEEILKHVYAVDKTSSRDYLGRYMQYPRPKLFDAFFWRTSGFTPLHFAARYGREATVEELLQDGSVNLQLKDSRGYSAYDWMQLMQELRQEENSSFVRKYVSNDPVHRVEAMEEARSGRPSLVRIASDLDEERRVMGELHDAWERGTCPSITMPVLEALLKDEELRCEKTHWLHWAVERDDVHLLKKLLVMKEIDVNEKDADGLSALERALGWGMYAAAKAILWHPRVILEDRIRRDIMSVMFEIADSDVLRCGKEYIDQEIENFLVVFVTRENLGGASANLQRLLLRWAQERQLDRVVDVILERPEVKRGLYEDRQVFLDCANAILVGAALIAGVAFQGWLQPPLGFTYKYGEELEYAWVEKGAVRRFWWFNNGAFFLAVGALIAGAKGAVPVAQDTDIVVSVEKVRRAVGVASVLLGLALVCVVGAFSEAGFAVVPPVHKDLRIMHRSVGWGATTCALALFWFLATAWPLCFETLRYFLHTVIHTLPATLSGYFQRIRGCVRDILGEIGCFFCLICGATGCATACCATLLAIPLFICQGLFRLCSTLIELFK